MHWVEREALQAKALVGNAGPLTEARLMRLIDLLNIELSHAPVDVSCCCWTPTGPRIIVSYDWRGNSQGLLQLSHEVAHVVFDHGLGSVLRHVEPGNIRFERLARLAKSREEAIANKFARALTLQ